MATDAQLQSLVDEMKAIVDDVSQDPEEIAKQWFSGTTSVGFHGKWHLLGEDAKEMWIKFAEVALSQLSSERKKEINDGQL